MSMTPITSNNMNFKQQQKNQDLTLPLAVIPGLHQFVNGRVKEGLIFSGCDIALGASVYFLNKSIMKDAVKGISSIANKDSFEKQKVINSLQKKKYGYFIIGAGAIALGLTNLIDAYKHPRKKQ